MVRSSRPRRRRAKSLVLPLPAARGRRGVRQQSLTSNRCMISMTRRLVAILACILGVRLAAAQAPAATWHPVGGRLLTRWAADVDPARVLPEYPRPQMVRSRWTNLNGLWEFAVVADSTAPSSFGRALPEQILVPFAMESALSGVGRHAERVVYRRTFRIPADVAAGERLLMHFGAVDWR